MERVGVPLDATKFDRLTRALSMGYPRRIALGGMLGALGILAISPGAVAKVALGGEDGKRRVTAQRKRRRRKKKPFVCLPNCDRKICGPDGCNGICGECEAPTTCDGRGRCVGCQAAGDCAAIPCRDVSCAAGVCQYAAIGNSSACGGGRVCCGGECTSIRTDPGNCGGCGLLCQSGRACLAGQCIDGCDVCPSGGCPFGSIQAAVDAAPDLTTVTICPGTYEQRVSLVNRSVFLVGLGNDPAATVIASSVGPIVDVAGTSNASVRNLTLTGVRSGPAGAVRNRASLTLDRVDIVDNRGVTHGAGIVNTGADTSLSVSYSRIVNNQATIFGGGIYNDGAFYLGLAYSVVEGNRAVSGGGIANSGGDVVIANSTAITGNTATGSAGAGDGVLNFSGTVSITPSSDISGNTPDNCVDAGTGTGCSS